MTSHAGVGGRSRTTRTLPRGASGDRAELDRGRVRVIGALEHAARV